MKEKGRVTNWQCTIFSVVRRFSVFSGKGIFPYCWHIRKGKSSYTDGTDVTWFISLGNIKIRFVSEY